MNEMNVILIQPVANGFVVTLPHSFPSQWEGLKEALPMHDPLLSTKKDKKEIGKTEHVFIFETMELVLAFLADKYITK